MKATLYIAAFLFWLVGVLFLTVNDTDTSNYWLLQAIIFSQVASLFREKPRNRA